MPEFNELGLHNNNSQTHYRDYRYMSLGERQIGDQRFHFYGTGITPNPDWVAPANVSAHQGYAHDGTFHYAIDTNAVLKYDANWNLVSTLSNVLNGSSPVLDHMGGGEIFNGKLYIATNDILSFGPPITGQTPAVVVIDIATFTVDQIMYLSGAPVTGSYNISVPAGLCIVDNEIKMISNTHMNFIFRFDLSGNYLGTHTVDSDLSGTPPHRSYNDIAFDGIFYYVTESFGGVSQINADNNYLMTHFGDYPGNAQGIYIEGDEIRVHTDIGTTETVNSGFISKNIPSTTTLTNDGSFQFNTDENFARLNIDTGANHGKAGIYINNIDLAGLESMHIKNSRGDGIYMYDGDTRNNFHYLMKLQSNVASAGSRQLLYAAHDNTGSSSDVAYLRQRGSGKVIRIQNDGSNDSIYDDSGAKLTAAGVFTNASSKTLKEGFNSVSVLDKLDQIQVQEYNYIKERQMKPAAIKAIQTRIDEINAQESKTEDDNKELADLQVELAYVSKPVKKHFTPFAEDFHQVFGFGDDTSISAGDLAGVALQAVKEQNEVIKRLEQKLDSLTN